MKSYMLVALTGLAATQVNAECANACSGHGTCGARDACSCYKNWMGNDCSLRICPFAHAFVDSPKGDLDMSGGALAAPASPVAEGDEVYPEGTTEQYPDAAANEGHFYMECANKGLCNRKSGECECFDGYEGTACARTVCPNTCSGHGTCETIQELAEMGTFDTTAVHAASTTSFAYSYNLWDHEKTVGCKCDEGFFGTDCAERKCKYGVDPLFESEGKRIAAEFNVFSDATAGSFKLKLFDVFGESYVTQDIPFDATADEFCQRIDILPNGVFDMDRSPRSNLDTEHEEFANAADGEFYSCDASNLRTSACCTRVGDGEWNVYLNNNPGPLKAPEFFTNTVDKYVTTNSGVSHVSFVAGEFSDRFGTKITTTSQLLNSRTLPISAYGTQVLTFVGTDAIAFVDAALTAASPRLLKIEHEVFVADSSTSGAVTLADSRQLDVSDTNALGAQFAFFSEAAVTTLAATVTKPAQGTNSWGLTADESLVKEQQFVYNNVLFTIETVSTDGLTVTTVENYGFAAASTSGAIHTVVWADPATSDFEYATQCSNRGTCDFGTGTCSCFSGYSNDNCDTQNAYSN